MDCRAFEQSVAHYEQGRLPSDERADFEAHAATCAACGTTFAGYQRSTCAWIADFLADYLEGTAAREETRVFEWHLAACEECRRYLQQYRATMRVACAASEVELALPPRLIAAVLSARPHA